MGKREVGFVYENLAKTYLEKKGLKFLYKNFTSYYGEIDLIFLDRKSSTLIFIEVKYRKNKFFGSSLEMVNKSKIEKILVTSKIFLQKYAWTGNVRYDVIGIEGRDENEGFSVKWIKNAFEV